MRAVTDGFHPGAIVAPALALAVLAVWILVAAPVPAHAAAPPSPKVKAALDLLLTNPSPQAFGDALKRAGLSKAEAQELVNELKTPRYDAPLRLLRQKAESAPHAGPPPQPVPRSLDLAALRQTLGQEHTALLARLQAQAPTGLQARVRAPAAAGGAAALGPQLVAFTGARAPANPSPVELERTDPEPAVTGVWLVIFGHQLGRQGEVTIIFGAEDPHTAVSFPCRIGGWGAEAIHVMVPTAIEDLHRAHPFPNGRRSALVWVKPQGDPSGRTREITVKVNPDNFVPQVESVSPGQLTPGLRFAVRGRNLSAGARPTVTLRASSPPARHDLQVLGYDADWVEVVVPDDLGGFRTGRATLTASNGLGESRPYGVDFTAVDEVLEFTSEPLSASCWSVLEMIGDAWFGGAIESLCIMGEEQRHQAWTGVSHDGYAANRLANDWTVASAVASATRRHGNGAGCYLEHAPAAGATEFTSTELVAWANGFCRVTCTATLAIRGPRGVPMSR